VEDGEHVSDVEMDAGPGADEGDPGDAIIGSAPTGERARSEARRAIEAIVMVADEPADPRLLAQLIEVAADLVEEICVELAAEYQAADRGFQLVKVAGGWRFQSHAELSPYVERFVLSGQSARLSAAALETLAIIAYKQPISRGQVSAIRGVNVDAVMRTLQQRGYIAELARDPGPGQAVLFGTTSAFLEKLGLNALEELPPLGEFVPGPDVLEALEQTLLVGDPDPVVDLTEPPEVIDLTDAGETLDALEVLADDPAE
jgi:segregation and condensation protein B